ncbi:MAG: endonuclease MutS2 [Candidatus Polarisedimenticolia bacterium]
MSGLDARALEALDFAEILALLSAETATPPGAGLAAALVPSPDAPAVRAENHLTGEAARHLEVRGTLPFGTVPDPGPLFVRLEVAGSVLGALEILDLLQLMKAGRRLKAFLAESRAEFPALWEPARSLPDLGNLVRFLDGKIAAGGELEDGASDALQSVRQEIRRRGERLQELLEAIVARPGVARALQDTFISIRSDRHVLPIRAEAQASLPGIVHGVSGTGATVFLEPIETVELNNDLVTLRERETTEVQRLLQEYSDLLRGRLPELRSLAAGVGRLDLVFARARLGRRLGARTAEEAGEAEGIVLEGARHPLVEASLRATGGGMVPLRLAVPPATRVLVLSGPNTGGKTVALKTVGLLAAMFQSGLMVPAERARLPVFRTLFIDIGDRQSIADRLSTFSARMRHVAAIAASLAVPGLVLLDEAGAGTDPEEGSALAIAIVDYFRRRGALVLVTTHLEALKAWAATTTDAANAAMEFEETTGTPTYRLIAGLPGRSIGLETAGRLGVPREILETARAHRGGSGGLLASYLARLQQLTADLEARSRALDAERDRLAGERERLLAGLRVREETQAAAVAGEIELALRSMREEGERYLSRLEDRRLALELRREEAKAAAPLKAAARELIRRTTGRAAPAGGAELRPGTAVHVEGLGVRGILESIRGERAVILSRGKRMTVAAADLRTGAAEAAVGAPRLPRGVRLERRHDTETPAEIHLLGRTVEEALSLVDKYLDDACLAGRTPVRLVHGIGSGRLRQAIAGFLSGHPHVEKFAPAPAERGGSGVTVVDLRV